MAEQRKEVLKAYQDAARELRSRHDDEFHEILERLYEERGIEVKKRRSRKQAARARLQAALEIVSAANAG